MSATAKTNLSYNFSVNSGVTYFSQQNTVMKQNLHFSQNNSTPEFLPKDTLELEFNKRI